MLGIEHVLAAGGGADWPFHVPVPGRGNAGQQPSIAQSREAAPVGAGPVKPKLALVAGGGGDH